jgi:hypothetical protein
MKKNNDRLQPLPDYVRELGPTWREIRDRKRIERRALDPECDEPPWPHPVRPSALVEELFRCAVLSSDQVFLEAMAALYRHGFVDSSGKKFLPRPLPEQTEVNEALVRAIEVGTDPNGLNWSLSYACTRVAAEIGFDAESLESATKRVEMQYRSCAKKTAAE